MGMIKRPAPFFFSGCLESLKNLELAGRLRLLRRPIDQVTLQRKPSRNQVSLLWLFFFFVYAAVLNQMSNYVQREVIVMHLHECVGASSSIRLDGRHPTYPDKDI